MCSWTLMWKRALRADFRAFVIRGCPIRRLCVWGFRLLDTVFVDTAQASRRNSVAWLGRWDWQVIQQVKKRRRDALRAQEHANLCHVPRFVNDQVPQQAIHRVALP